MMDYSNIKVITFANNEFIKSKDILFNFLNCNGITNLRCYSDEDLPLWFKTNHSDLFKMKRGYGYWIWKPYIIINELTNIDDKTILVYIDSTDMPTLKLFDFILGEFNDGNNNLFFNRGYNNGDWTKMDCFEIMKCNEDKYKNSIQLEAGLLSLNNNNSNIELMNEWLGWCGNINVISDIPNICGIDNPIRFVEHRHDQSILTNLIIKNSIESVNLNSEYIKYNHNQPNFNNGCYYK